MRLAASFLALALGFATNAVAGEQGAALSLVLRSQAERLSPFLVPELRLAHEQDGNFLEFAGEGEFGTHFFGDHREDANAHAEFAVGKELPADIRAALELEYTFERDYDPDFSPAFAVIDDSHTVFPNLAVSIARSGFSFDLNVGAQVKLHEDLVRIGRSPFDRRRRDHLAPEIALRTTMQTGIDVDPFIELAYVGRFYRDRDDLGRNRNYQGGELIGGVTFVQPDLQGDLGVIGSLHDHASGEIADSLAIGPFVDLKWQAGPHTLLSLAALASLVQEETGPLRSTPTYSGVVTIEQGLSDRTNLKASFGVTYEAAGTSDAELTVAPALELAWNATDNIAVIAGAGVEILKARQTPAEISSSFSLSVKVTR